MRRYRSQVTGALRVDIIQDHEPSIAWSGVQLETWVAGAIDSAMSTISSIVKSELTPLVPKLFAWLILPSEIGDYLFPHS